MRLLVFISCVLLAAETAKPQDYQLHRLDVSELPPAATSDEIHLDRLGLLWFSQGGKLFRYDGYDLAEIPLQDTAGKNVSSGYMAIFSEDSSGQLWLLDYRYGPAMYSSDKRTFLIKEFNGEGFRHIGSEVTHMLHTSDQMLWLSLQNGDLALVEPDTGEVQRLIKTSSYLHPEDSIASLLDDTIDGIRAVSMFGVLLRCYRTSHNCATVDLGKASGAPGGIRVEQAVMRNSSSLVINSYEHGVYEATGLLTENNNLERAQSSIRLSQLTAKNAWAIYKSPGERLWISTQEGLHRLTRDDNLHTIETETGEANRILVTDFSTIDERRILAQSATDIYVIKKKIFQSFASTEKLASLMTTSFSEGKDGSILVGSLGGIDRLRFGKNDWESTGNLITEENTAGAQVMALTGSDQGFFWFGGITGGLRKMFLHQGADVVVNEDRELDAISVIAELDESTLIVGSPYHGVFLVSHLGRVLAHVNKSTSPHALLDNRVYSVIKAAKDRILAGGDGGVSEIQFAKNADGFVVIESHHYLKDETILDFLISSDGTLWVGTYHGGLYRAPEKSEGEKYDFRKVVTHPELQSTALYTIEEDDAGDLWLGTDRGLVRLKPGRNVVSVFDRSDGTLDDDFNLGASFKDSNGLLYFGGNKGFIRFDPRDFEEHRVPPPLRLTEIMIHREPVPYDPVYMDIPELVLSHNDHSLDVEFSTMDIISPGRSRYKYKLENFDDDWVDIGTRNSATFTSLPAGEYVLRVIGADSKGVWNYDGIVLPVRVLPAPWLTWWAFTLYALALLGFFALVKRSYDTYLQKVAATREAEQMKITATLAMDDLQDQLEVENRLVDNLRKHASSAFDMVDEFLTMELEELYGEEIEEPLGRARQRLHCLKALEASVYFHGDQLKVNFRDAVDRSFAEVLRAHPHPAAELVLANDCSEALIPIDIAAPLILLAHELMLNSVIHAFPDSIGVECIEVIFQPQAGGYGFEIADSGCGLPNAIDPACPTTLGMELIARIAARLGANIEVDRERGTHYRISVPGTTS